MPGKSPELNRNPAESATAWFLSGALVATLLSSVAVLSILAKAASIFDLIKALS